MRRSEYLEKQKVKRRSLFAAMMAIIICIAASIIVYKVSYKVYVENINIKTLAAVQNDVKPPTNDYNKEIKEIQHEKIKETEANKKQVKEDAVKEASNKIKDTLVKQNSLSKGSIVVNSNAAISKDGVKTAFLTFDDGPTPNITPEVLKILDKYNIKATFFVVGKLAEAHKDLIKMEYNKGHAIGNHSYSHNYKDIYASINNFEQDFDRTNNILKNILGENFHNTLFRFPGGSFEKYKEPYKELLAEKGYNYIDWNALNGDAEGKDVSAEKLIDNVKNTVKGKEDVVILMHDAAAKKNTVQALPHIIEYLKSEGYVFKVLK